MHRYLQVVVFALSFGFSALALAEPWTITGNVSGPGGNVVGTEVQVNDSSGNYLSSYLTDASGNYSLQVDSSGDYYVSTPVQGMSDTTLKPVVYPGTYCANCDVTGVGVTPIAVSSDTASIDFVLETGGVISGNLSTSGAAAIDNGDIAAFNYNGEWIGSTNPDSNGDFSFALPDGTYWIQVEAYGAFEYYVTQFHDSTECPWQQCDPYNNMPGITANPGSEDILNFNLNLGMKVSGTVVETGTATGIDNVDMQFRIGSDVYFGMSTQDGGLYVTPALPVDSYYVVANGDPVGYVTEVYNDIICPAGNCDPVIGGATQLSTTAGNTDVVDFDLDTGRRFSGVIDDLQGPAGNGYVRVFLTNGTFLLDVWPDGSGYYESPPLAPGLYFAYAWGEDFGHVTELYDGIPCPHATCDMVTLSTHIDLTSGDQGSVNFTLVEQDWAYRLSGTITTAGGGAAQGGATRVFDGIGNYMGDYWVDGDGYWESDLFPNDVYYVTTVFTQGVMDELWDWGAGTPCPNQDCDPLSDGGIGIDGGDIGGIDFVLDPAAGGRIHGTITTNGGSTPLPNVLIEFFNASGIGVLGAWTDDNGNYESPWLVNGDVYLRTKFEPLGLTTEFYNDKPCKPDCYNSGWIVANADAVNTAGGDVTGIDIDLALPGSGYTISGDVVDEELGHTLPQVHLVLFDSDGNEVDRTDSDSEGSYYFTGLSNGDYRIYAEGVPQNYDQELFENVDCPDGSCDFSSDGTLINITDGDNDGNNIVLDFNGDRIFGTITRSDSGNPVTANIGYMRVDAFYPNGDWAGEAYANSKGQYTLFLGPGDYRLHTSLDVGFHGLLNEHWVAAGDNYCDVAFGCDSSVGDLVTVDGVDTPVADFVLDPGSTISGNVSGGGNPLGGVQVCVTRRDGWWLSCTQSESSGDYTVVGLPFESDLLVFINDLGGQSFQQETWNGWPGHDWENGDGIDVSSSNATGKDFTLEAGYTISGTVLDGGSPVEGIGICIHLKSDGSFTGVCAGTDSSGNYVTQALPPGNDYMAYVTGDEFGYKRQMWDGIDCDGYCDLILGDAIDLTSSSATNIDFNVTPSDPGVISGSILDWNDQRVDGAVILYDSNGNWFDQFGVDENGNFETYPLPTGVYYAVTKYTWGNVDDVWDGNDGYQCPNQLCNPLDHEPIEVPSGQLVEGINFRLDAIDNPHYIRGHVEDGSGTPIEFLKIIFRNLNGDYLFEVRTNEAGNYESPPFLHDFYYVDAAPGPMGLAPEIYDDVQCAFYTECEDGNYIVTNGTPIELSADENNADFVLEMRAGWTISGQVTDSGNGRPLTDTWVQLFDEFENYYGQFQTDAEGKYYFTGLPNNSYRIFVSGPPQGYEPELYSEIPCPGYECLAGSGTPIDVVDGDQPNKNIALDYTGTRLFGTVTRADNGDPVSGNFGAMGVNLFDDAGNQITGTGTDSAGNYQFHLPDGTASYYLATDHDSNYHALINECWDDLKCADWFDPAGAGADLILVPDGTTVIADFVLDPIPTISGTVTSDIGAVPLEGILMTLSRKSDGARLRNSYTDASGQYQFTPDEARNDLVVWTRNMGPQPYFPEVYQDQVCAGGFCDADAVLNGTSIDITTGSKVVDMSLAKSASISGTLSRSDPAGLLGNGEGRARLYRQSDNTLAAIAFTNANGDYRLVSLDPGNYYLRLSGNNNNLIDELYDDANGIYCPELFCDKSSARVFTITGAEDITNIDATLDAGTQFSGNVSENGVPLNNIFINFYAETGELVGAGRTGNDGSGDYVTFSGFPAGNYRAANRWMVNGVQQSPQNDQYAPVAYPDTPCGTPCDVTAGNTFVADGAPTIVTGIDFAFEDATASISGNITGSDTGLAIENISLWLFDLDCNYIDYAITDSNGDYTVPVNVPGDFYLFAIASDTWDINLKTGYINQQYPGINVHDSCYTPVNDVTLGEVIVVGENQKLTGKDFILDPGGTITGTISDSNGVLANETAVARLYRASDGAPQKNAINKEPDGSYHMGGLIPGTYQVVLSAFGRDLIDERWADEHCPRNSCDPVLGDVVDIVTGLEVIPGVDAVLESGAVIRGHLSDAQSGLPVANYCAWIYNEAGVYATPACSDANGDFQSSNGLPDGNYRLSNQLKNPTHQPVAGGYIPQVWTNDGTFLACGAECDFTLGDTFTVNGTNPVENIDLAMLTSLTISGTVTAQTGGTPLQDVRICVGNKLDESIKQCAVTDGTGFYEVDGLYSLNDYVVYTDNVGGQAYYREMYDNQACCDVANGTSVDLTGGSAVIDFALASSGRIAGHVTDSGTGLGIADLWIWLLDESCNVVEGINSTTDGGGSPGFYSISGVPDGIYYVLAVGEYWGYMNELYPDIKRINPCAGEYPVGQAIVIENKTQVDNVDFALDPGGSISGVISDSSGMIPSNRAYMRLYDADGILIDSYGDWLPNWTPDVSYIVGGLPPGDYQVVFTSVGLGLIDERFDDEPCPRNSCDQLLGNPVSVGPGEQLTGIDGELSPGAVIRGRITDAVSGDGVPGYAVAIYNSLGIYAGVAVADGDGYFETNTGFPDGDYYMSNQFPSNLSNDLGGYLPQAWTNDGSFGGCGEPCNVLLGDAFTVSGLAPVENINLVMETGTTISGAVTTGGATPLTNVTLQLRSSSDGSVIRSVVTDGSGAYQFAGVGSGTYFIRTLNTQGYSDRLYASISCNPFCDPLTGTPINADGFSDIPGISFDLPVTPAIAGVVRDDSVVPVPVAGVKVQAFDVLGTLVASATSNGAGEYLIKNLYAGNFYVKTANTTGYVDGLWSGLSCLPGCNPTMGNLIPVGVSGTTAGKDLVLAGPSTLSGTVSHTGGPLAGVTVQVYSAAGALVGSSVTDAVGNYSVSGLKAGDYHAVTRNTFGYINKGAGGSVCQPATCAPTSTAVVAVPSKQTVVRNFVLDPGGVISGTVATTGAVPLQSVTVRAYNAAGVQVGSSTSNASGSYSINGLAGPAVFLRTTNAMGYQNQRYNGLACGSTCNVLTGTSVAVSAGANVTGKNFALALGGSISGVVRNTSAVPITNVQVQVLDAISGVLAGTAVSGAGGAYTVGGLADGNYRLKAISSSGYIDRIRGGDNCSPEPCVLATGTPTGVASANVTGVDITLSLGGSISGVVTTPQEPPNPPIPLPLGTAWIYSATGQLVKQGGIFNGSFFVNGLANGTYHMVVTNGSGLVDQLWQDLPCPSGSCDIAADGTDIEVTGAEAGNSVPGGVAYGLADGVAGGGAPAQLNFSLEPGYRISGSLKFGATPITSTKVYFFDADGKPVGEAITNGVGEFILDSGLPNGSYFAATSRAARPEDTPEEAVDAENGAVPGLTDEIWSDFPCTGVCAPSVGAAIGTPIVINGADKGGIDIVLSAAAGITLEKRTNGIDADTPDGGEAPEIAVGATVNWTYELTNTGGYDLVNIAVVDDPAESISCSETSLSVGQSTTCTASGPALDLSSGGIIGNCSGTPNSKLFQNTATVTAETVDAVVVMDEDTSHYCNPLTPPSDLIFKNGFE